MDSKDIPTQSSSSLSSSSSASPSVSVRQQVSTSAPFIATKSLIPASHVQQKNTSPQINSQKILSRNSNGTVVMTSSPSNEAELQLYRVMQKASLLAYYDTLLEMGGDDVQQLCDAGEEEFLEIMALVGMASKPLHVRRLQKALQEWVANPAMFQIPLTQGTSGGSNPLVPGTHAMSPASNAQLTIPVSKEVLPPCASPDSNQVVLEPNNQMEVHCRGSSPSPSPSPIINVLGPTSPTINVNPVLVESQILKLAEAAEALVKTLPQFEPKPHNTKKKICRNLEVVMNMSEDDPRRMDEIRKYSAIYGRFDCKRNPQKPLTLHEVSVNEAAAQICRFAPALLTRRDDLFSLARQVVRDSGYHFTKVHSSFLPIGKTVITKLREENPSCKRAKLDTNIDPTDVEKFRRQDRLEQIAEELKILGIKTDELVRAAQQVRQTNDLSSVTSLQQEMEAVQNKQTKLLVEQSELLKQPLPSRFYRRNGSRTHFGNLELDRTDTDDTDSQLSLSNASSPSQEVGDSRDSLIREGDAVTGANNDSGGGGLVGVKSPMKSGKQEFHLRSVWILHRVAGMQEDESCMENLKFWSNFDETSIAKAKLYMRQNHHVTRCSLLLFIAAIVGGRIMTP